MTIRGYYRSMLFPTFFLGGCASGLNDNIVSGLMKTFHTFQNESGENHIV